MDIVYQIFGEGKDLNMLQMGSRAFVVFFITLVFIRLAGMRTFGLKTAFDNIIVIMLGAIMSRAITGASPFFPTIVAGFVLVVIHKVLAWVGIYSVTVNHAIKGEFCNLYRDGKFDDRTLKKFALTVDEVMEEVRTNTNADTLDKVTEINMERSGKLSIIKQDN